MKDTGIMRRLVHLSDLHFGRTRPALIHGLHFEILKIQPDLIVVSGDLTQRATPIQFRKAHNFLQSLPFPKLVVPGNHDIPFWNLPFQIFRPFSRYQTFISKELFPLFEDEEISVQGLTPLASGTKILAHWQTLPPSVIRVLVSHQPLGAQHPLTRHADLILSGHFHQGEIFPAEHVYMTQNRSIIEIRAGTATSTRIREEPNSYNVLQLSEDEIQYEKRTWSENEGSFFTEKTKRFFNHPHPDHRKEPSLQPDSWRENRPLDG